MTVATKLRTRAVWALMRLVEPAQLSRLRGRRVVMPLVAWLTRGELQVLGGMAVNVRLSAAHFPFWGTQSYGMLVGAHEPEVQEALRRHLEPGSTFIDVGANAGIASLLAARLVGADGRVVALDPQVESALAVRANAACNDFGQLQVLQVAAGAENGRAEVVVTADGLWTRLASVGDHPLEVRRDNVEIRTLDSLSHELALDRVDAIKIDVEGAELDVIRGMRQLLDRFEPAVICEMHGKNAEYVDLMRDLGYTVLNLEGPRPVPAAHGNVHTIAVKDRHITA